MIVGHYATALVPYSRLHRKAPLWLLLLCAQIPELLWLGLSLGGVETPAPDSMLDATFQNLRVEMTYSHNLAPTLGQAALVTGIVGAATRSRVIALWCGALTVVHVLCDYLVGFEHQLLGPDSLPVALDSYGRFPHLAIGFEWAFSAALIAWYHQSEALAGRSVPRGRRIALHAIFAIGILVWLPAATSRSGPCFPRIRVPDGSNARVRPAPVARRLPDARSKPASRVRPSSDPVRPARLADFAPSGRAHQARFARPDGVGATEAGLSDA